MLSVFVNNSCAYGWLDLRDTTAVSGMQRLMIDEDQPGRLKDKVDTRNRASSVMARTLLRFLTAGLSGTSPDTVQIFKDSAGRPWVCSQGHERRQYASLSHSRHLVAAAVDVYRPIGIDIEFDRVERNYTAIANRIFTEQIARLIKSATDFYRCWCLYEAWIKAGGSGSDRWKADDRINTLIDGLLLNQSGASKQHGDGIFLPMAEGYTGCVFHA